MTEKYRIQALENGAWKTQSIFSTQDTYQEVRSRADQLVNSDQFEGVRILEAYKQPSSDKTKYKTVYTSLSQDSKPTPKAVNSKPLPQPEADVYETTKGITGEWVQVSAREAKRHPMYGVSGWLFLYAFSSIAGLISDVLAYKLWAVILLGPIMLFEDPQTAILGLIFLAFVVIIYVVPLWLLFKKHRYFQPTTITLLTLITVFSLTTIDHWKEIFSLGLTVLWIGYMALSERVNVTTRHRVRPAYLKKVSEGDYPAPQSIVSSSDW